MKGEEDESVDFQAIRVGQVRLEKGIFRQETGKWDRLPVDPMRIEVSEIKV